MPITVDRLSNSELYVIDNDLKQFLVNWDHEYGAQVNNIKLFDTNWISSWNINQKRLFIKVLYHLRGHFYDFLWYLGSYAQDKETKDIVLQNISEEFNGSAKSHDQMYVDFAKAYDIDIKDEILNQTTYLPFAKKFNQDHLEWMFQHDAPERFSAFSAYERLDNIDYKYLLRLVEAMGVNKKLSLFFKVHSVVEHFESTEQKLITVWGENPEKVKNAFHFISQHQVKMWKDFTKAIEEGI